MLEDEDDDDDDGSAYDSFKETSVSLEEQLATRHHGIALAFGGSD